MVKKYSVFFVLISLVIYRNQQLYAQQIAPSIINTSGGTQTALGLTLNFNVGTTAISKLSNGVYSITQGFLQPQILSTTLISESTKADTKWQIYPNPVVDVLTISALNYKDAVWVKLIDNAGREVLQTEVINNKIAVSVLPTGIYLLQVLNNKKEILVSKSITKIN